MLLEKVLCCDLCCNPSMLQTCVRHFMMTKNSKKEKITRSVKRKTSMIFTKKKPVYELCMQPPIYERATLRN